MVVAQRLEVGICHYCVAFLGIGPALGSVYFAVCPIAGVVVLFIGSDPYRFARKLLFFFCIFIYARRIFCS